MDDVGKVWRQMARKMFRTCRLFIWLHSGDYGDVQMAEVAKGELKIPYYSMRWDKIMEQAKEMSKIMMSSLSVNVIYEDLKAALQQLMAVKMKTQEKTAY